MKKFYTVLQAAELLQKTEHAIRIDIHRKRLPHKRLGRRILIPVQELDDFLDQLPGVSATEAADKVNGV